MANEIQADYSSGNMLYAVVRNQAGQVWCASQQAFENWGTSGHTAADYDIALTDKSGSCYVGDIDVNVPSGCYCVQLFVQAGASPADTDVLVAGRDIIWTGAGELTAIKILANKAVHDKVAGVIDYYDDDDETVIFKHTLDDEESSATRSRS